MKRSHFLAIAGVIACFFGLSMILVPDMMLANMTTLTGDAAKPLRWLGTALLTVGVINIYARNDTGSDALRAIMSGNIVLHVVAEMIDVIDYRAGVVKGSGVAMGTIVHSLLTIGFIYYLVKLGPKSA